MTAQLLAGELSGLIQDTRRKNPDIRAAAEKSLSDLKAFPNTSESQLSADLRRKPDFVRPFFLACRSGNSKYAGPSILSLQRLVSINGFASEKLEELLASLRESSSLGTDVQLRILQIMPSLFQQYGSQITDTRLTAALQICFLLQASKNGIISNTSAATLQQIVGVVFGRIGSEKLRSETLSPETTKVSWQAELDCHQVLQDLCLIAEGKPAKALEKTAVSTDFAFEMIGTILSDFTFIIPRYSNFVDILRQQLLPLIIRILSSAASFNSTCRSLRLIPPIVEGLIDVLPNEVEMLLSMLTYMLEPDSGPSWKRVMCLEVIRDTYKEGSAMRKAYVLFDQQEKHKAIVQEQLNMISRLASEKPAVIGLGQSSSLPMITEQSGEDLDSLSALQADPLTATTGVSLTTRTSTKLGIGVELSTMKVSLIDQLDKADPPSVPASYIYATSLTAINNLSEALARFILPFASTKATKSIRRRRSKSNADDEDMHDDEETRLPTNPLQLEGHKDSRHIEACAGLLKDCWPAFLSVYSTFFQAALDAEFYHGIIRSFQKLIQTVTLLRLATPRDAFLTALAKQSLPIDGIAHIHVQSTNEPEDRTKAAGSTSQSLQLTPRNLLCLRALLNLGIVLGAVLEDSWDIILNTLQQADVTIGYRNTERTISRGGPAAIAPSIPAGGETFRDLSNEISAVRSAALRLFNSTADLPIQQFLAFLPLLRKRFRGLHPMSRTEQTIDRSDEAHRRTASESTVKELQQDVRYNVFVIDAFSQVSESNKFRFASDDPGSTGWRYLVESISELVNTKDIDPELRIAAAESVCRTVTGATFSIAANDRHASLVPYGFSVLLNLAKTAIREELPVSPVRSNAEEIHQIALRTLKICLDQYGESIENGWSDVCDLMLSAFEQAEQGSVVDSELFTSAKPISAKLLRASFSSLQVVCSEIIETIPRSCLPKILRSVYLSTRQRMDLNISLTATTLYQNISDHIWSSRESLDLTNCGDGSNGTHMLDARLWLQVLAALCESSSVDQAEMRNSAVHALFRILSGVGENLKHHDWRICIESVLVKLYDLNSTARKMEMSTGRSKLAMEYDETAVSIHTGVCNLFEEHIVMMLEKQSALDMWTTLVDRISELLNRKSLALASATYSNLSRILDSIGNENAPFSSFVPALWILWDSNNPYDSLRLDRPSASDNQSALLTYIEHAISLYKVTIGSRRSEVACIALAQVHTSITKSTPTNYANDLHSMTPLQVECTKLIELVYEQTAIAITPLFLSSVCSLTVLPYTIIRKDEEKGPTYVRFSKGMIAVLRRCIDDRAETCKLYEQTEARSCLEALGFLISKRSTWKREEQMISIWKDALEAVVKSSERLMVLSRQSGFSASSIPLWKSVLHVLDLTVASGEDYSAEKAAMKTDLAFEINAFQEFFGLLVPSLGSTRLDNSVRCAFAQTLMLRSLIHEHHPDDTLNPAESQPFNVRRLGRVKNLPPSDRAGLCYVLIDRMFDLVAQAGRSEDHSRLAESTSPYLLLRVELVLKAYICDQPLRGRMPCPLSQKQELLYLLQKSVDLCKLDDMYGEAENPRTSSPGEKQTQSLQKLAIMAMRITKYDEDIKEILLNVIEA